MIKSQKKLESKHYFLKMFHRQISFLPQLNGTLGSELASLSHLTSL